ncbi:MAG: hypothetical protein HOH43_18260 [Candidatus Latescibacteria bacterium]|jgi:hypothetical protein|nr:hypothetical protein [Candidatus Latescibacterota bacterium]
MKPALYMKILILSSMMGILSSGCGFSTKDNVVGPDMPAPGNGSGPDTTTVSFASDIQPIFDLSCVACHGSQGGLSLVSYDALITGGNSGTVVMPGNGPGSLLVKRIDGTIPPVMPAGGAPLSADNITLIITWIDEGAFNN